MKLGISGHQEIPPAILPRIEVALREEIARTRAKSGISSLAKGADQLFAYAIIDAGLPLEAIIPCTNYELTFTDPVSATNFHVLLNSSRKIETLNYPDPTELAFLAAGQRTVDTCDRMIAIWDGAPAKGQGGTAEIVAYARKVGKPVFVIWP